MERRRCVAAHNGNGTGAGRASHRTRPLRGGCRSSPSGERCPCDLGQSRLGVMSATIAAEGALRALLRLAPFRIACGVPHTVRALRVRAILLSSLSRGRQAAAWEAVCGAGRSVLRTSFTGSGNTIGQSRAPRSSSARWTMPLAQASKRMRVPWKVWHRCQAERGGKRRTVGPLGPWLCGRGSGRASKLPFGHAIDCLFHGHAFPWTVGAT